MKDDKDITYRSVKDSFWTDFLVLDLLPDEKLFYIWLFTNQHLDICGCYQINIRTIEYETGLSRDSISILISRFIELERIKYNPETLEIILLKWKKNNEGFFKSSNSNSLKSIRSGATKVKCEEFRNIIFEWLGATPPPTQGATPPPTQGAEHNHKPLTINQEPITLKSSSSPLEDIATEQRAKMMINDFRFVHQDKFGTNMPPGCNAIASELCQHYPRDSIIDAFETAAVQGKTTVAYVKGVLMGNGSRVKEFVPRSYEEMFPEEANDGKAAVC
jgi:hypothetical protein